MMKTSPTKPYFIFPDIPPSGQLSFVKLTSENFTQLYTMFEADANQFTDKRFKHYEEAKKYAQGIEEYGAYSPKHGGQDWFFLWEKEVSGILHLYDLSLETFAENNLRCWVGFATKPVMRNKGITKKALLYFMQYIFKYYPLIKYIHVMTLKENVPAQRLIKATGFKADQEGWTSKEYMFYLMEKNSLA
jgi:RimJ/RimL family protein N-acetyltransferase